MPAAVSSPSIHVTRLATSDRAVAAGMVPREVVRRTKEKLSRERKSRPNSVGALPSETRREHRRVL